MKNNKILIVFALLFVVSANVLACEIKFNVEGDSKKAYSVGDELVVEVEVIFTHGHCHVSLDDTKFNYQGIEVLGATKWNKVSEMKYTRKIKIKITEDNKNKSLLSATRSCHKEGGYGSIEIKRE